MSAGQWLGAAGLLAGLVAIGMVGWQMLHPPREIVVSGNVPQPQGQPDQETASGSSDKDASTDDADLENSENDEVEGDGEPGLTELKPNGSIAVPKPRPPRAKPQEALMAHLPDPDLVERGATGVIPKRSEDGRRAMDVYAREPDTTGNFGVARVVLIVGGMGVSQTSSQAGDQTSAASVVLAFAPYGNSAGTLDAGGAQERA